MTYKWKCTNCFSYGEILCSNGIDALAIAREMHKGVCNDTLCVKLVCQQEEEKKGDPVSSPAHYNSHPAKIECIDVIEWFSCNIANAIKYLWRCGLKGKHSDAVQDLRKAAWYCNREADRLEKMKS